MAARAPIVWRTDLPVATTSRTGFKQSMCRSKIGENSRHLPRVNVAASIFHGAARQLRWRLKGFLKESHRLRRESVAQHSPLRTWLSNPETPAPSATRKNQCRRMRPAPMSKFKQLPPRRRLRRQFSLTTLMMALNHDLPSPFAHTIYSCRLSNFFHEAISSIAIAR